MKRIRMVAGNWKMNMTYEMGRDLVMQVRDGLAPSEVKVVFCPPYIHLKPTSISLHDVLNLHVGAQNCHESEKGAFTGEISASMLKSVGCEYVILGHSERREIYKESHKLIGEKVKAVLANGMKPIFCFGEKLDSREAKKQNDVVKKQLKESLFDVIEKEDIANVVLAYEPVWAIGTGKTASPKQAQEMHEFIRSLVAKKYGKEAANLTTILYGGSVKPANAKELFGQPDVDGGLIGGASLKANDFVEITKAFF